MIRKNRSIQDYKLTRLNWECYEEARYNDSTVKCVYFSFDHTYQYTSKWKEDLRRPKSAPFRGCKRARILPSWLQAIHSTRYEEVECASSTVCDTFFIPCQFILANPYFTIHVVENSNQHVVRMVRNLYVTTLMLQKTYPKREKKLVCVSDNLWANCTRAVVLEKDYLGSDFRKEIKSAFRIITVTAR